MTKRFVPTGFLSGLVLGIFIASLAYGVAVSAQAPPQGGQAQGRGQRGPAAPAAPCGPAIAGDLGKNTDPNSRCFELRMYTVDPTRDGVGQFKGGITELHKRFREGEVDVFKKNGVDVMAVWQDLGDPNTLIYLLSYKDRAARDAGWAGFNADPKWTELRTKYFVPLTTKTYMMSATDYSPLK
jgi:NIPSNAP